MKGVGSLARINLSKLFSLLKTVGRYKAQYSPQFCNIDFSIVTLFHDYLSRVLHVREESGDRVRVGLERQGVGVLTDWQQ